MNVILHTTHCPKCTVLEKKLNEKSINYDINEDINLMMEKGLTSAPGLEVDGAIMNFTDANKWINEH